MGDIPRSDPASTPRIGHGGDTERLRPIFRVDQYGRKVEVTPLGGGAAGEGRALNGGGEGNRTTFEVRAEFKGPALPGFEASRAQRVTRVETWNTRDRDLALAVARRADELLRAGFPKGPESVGVEDIYLPAIAVELGGQA